MKNNNQDSNIKISKLKSCLKKPWVIILLSFIALFMILLTVYFLFQVGNYRQIIANEKVLRSIDLSKDVRAKTPVFINTENNFSLGASDPELTIVEFSDFSCPYCKEMSLKLRNILKTYPNRVKLVYKDYPVINEEGLTFALAARCAGNKNGMLFWMIHDALFDAQGLLDREGLIELSEVIGVDKDEFTSCIDNEEYLDDIKKDAQEAKSLGVEITPTLFLNGRMVPGDMPEEILFKIVQEFLDNQ